MTEALQIRVHGDASLPTLIYLPGLHGDWTLVSSFRAAVRGRVRFVEVAYPSTTTWTMEDYGRAVLDALRSHDVRTGWVLGESFGSQVAWQLLELAAAPASPFEPDGLILAGGFVRYPLPWGVHLVSWVNRLVPMCLLRAGLRLYVAYAHLRHRHAPETLASIGEFFTRRSEPADKQAIVHRYSLILASDPRAFARQWTRPLFHLTGLVDPIVPFWLVRPWLRRHCPGYRGRRLIWRADHNVLGTAPLAAAEQVLSWMNAQSGR